MRLRRAGVIPVTMVLAAAAVSQTYTTSFPLTEILISEGGKWINGGTVGLDWTNVSTTPGLAIGHEGGIVDYTDATALLSGTWGPDQSVMAGIYSVNQNDACYEEVEIRLRSALAAHSCTGYEISFKCTKTSGAYLIIVRWNGAVGDFTVLRELDGSDYGVTSGDSIRATIVGNVITAYLNGVQKAQVTDATFKTGSPGMGFNLHGCTGVNGDYGYTKFTASAAGALSVGQSGDESLPGLFALEPNYPNPFNPRTTIRFTLPERTEVLLTVVNMLGEHVATLVRGTQEAGEHSASFDGAGAASGVYFCTLQAGTFRQTRALVLVR